MQNLKFSEGDQVIYAPYGVCTIEEICTVDMEEVEPGTLFYRMIPASSPGSTVYIPADGRSGSLRALMSREEADRFLERIGRIETIWIRDERRREQTYRSAVRSCNPEELMRIIKTIYMRKEERQAEGKLMTTVDRKYFELAESLLYTELSAALRIPREGMLDFLTQYMQGADTDRKRTE